MLDHRVRFFCTKYKATHLLGHVVCVLRLTSNDNTNALVQYQSFSKTIQRPTPVIRIFPILQNRDTHTISRWLSCVWIMDRQLFCFVHYSRDTEPFVSGPWMICRKIPPLYILHQGLMMLYIPPEAHQTTATHQNLHEMLSRVIFIENGEIRDFSEVAFRKSPILIGECVSELSNCITVLYLMQMIITLPFQTFCVIHYTS